MGSLERFTRKTTPQADRGSRISDGIRGAHPVVETNVFSLDSIRDGERLPGPQIELPLPLTQFQVASRGGGRTIGGGTSKEAFRRAKKKAS